MGKPNNENELTDDTSRDAFYMASPISKENNNVVNNLLG